MNVSRIEMIAGRVAPIVLILLLVPPRANGGEMVDRLPSINIILLDDGTPDLPQELELRRNKWSAWHDRLPTFLSKLNMLAPFDLASGDNPGGDDSLYALEIAALVSRERTEGIVAAELSRIHDRTHRPSAILARSSVGTDQLRIVFQDARDYPPAHAAKFLRILADMSPPIPYRLIAESFGPFVAPPTFVVDPRVNSLCNDHTMERLSMRRWGVLEDTYLLPEYVLHMLATLMANTRTFGDTFYPQSVPETGTAVAKRARTDMFIAGAGINSPMEQGQTDVLRMTLARSGANTLIAPMDLQNWKHRGLTLDNPRTATEIRTYASMMTSRAQAQGKNIVFDIRPGLDPYLVNKSGPRVGDIVDYLHNSPRWKGESQLYALAVDSVTRGFKDIQPVGRTNGLFHSEGGYAWSMAKSTLDSVELYKVRVGPDMAVPAIRRVKDAGGDVKLFTGRGDYWSAWNLATKSTAQKVALETGCLALHNKDWGGHGLPIASSRFEVYSGITGSTTHLTLNPTALRGIGLGTRLDLNTGGVLFDRGNEYVLDLTGQVRKLGEEAMAATDAGSGFGGNFRENDGQRVTVSIPMGGRWRTVETGASDLLLFDRDAYADAVGYLPVVLPRFWIPGTAIVLSFGGGWTFEPIITKGMDNVGEKSPAYKQYEVSVVPLETGNRLPYRADRIAGDQAPNEKASTPATVSFVPKGGDFQPDLVANENGTYSWILRHGVVVTFGGDGLVQTIRGPAGEHLLYVRSGQRLVGQQASDGRSITVEYTGDQPVTATRAGSGAISYSCESGYLLEVKATDHVCTMAYDTAGRLSVLLYNHCKLGFWYNRHDRLTKITAADRVFELQYVPDRGLLGIADAQGGAVQWHFGAQRRIAGVTLTDAGVLWTRSSDGRIIQMTVGSIAPAEDGCHFRPDVVVGVQSPTDK